MSEVDTAPSKSPSPSRQNITPAINDTTTDTTGATIGTTDAAWRAENENGDEAELQQLLQYHEASNFAPIYLPYGNHVDQTDVETTY